MAAVDQDQYSTIRFWDHLVQRGATQALATIQTLIRDRDVDGDALALAHGAAGRCLFEAGRIDEALAAATEASAASANGSREVRTWVAMGASFVLAESGRIDEALGQLEALADESSGVDLGRIRVQIACILHHAGRLNEALTEFDVSERLLGGRNEGGERLRVHHNRGVVLLQQGDLVRAEEDFRSAERIAAEHGLLSAQAQSVANLAVLLGRSRRLADALREFERAADLFERAGSPPRPVAIMSIDQAEVMMHSGLLGDAVEAGRAAIASVERTGNSLLLGDAQLVTARAEFASGRARAAASTARSAAQTFQASGRPEMVAHARSIEVAAALEAARSAPAADPLLDSAADVIAAMRGLGWGDQADALAAVRVRAGRRWGRFDAVRADVDRLRVGAADGRRDTALAGWWAEALALESVGDTTGAVESCHAGLTVLDDIVAEAPDLEARSAAMRMGADLSQLLIELAVDRRDAETVFSAAEGTRARALHDELAGNERHEPLTRAGAEKLHREITERLGSRSLVQWVLTPDRVLAAVLDADGSRLVDVGDRREIVRARDRLLVWLDVAASEPDESSARAMQAAKRLDELVIAPLRLRPDEGVVVVPTDLLHGIPWSGLPSLCDRPFTLAPNAQVWLESDRRADRRIVSVGVVVGPRVANSDVESRAVASAYPGDAVAASAWSTATIARSMLAECDLVHVAAHGTFRSDHPLLSTLSLHDGEATLYDVVPSRVESLLAVLSSCEGGAHGTADGSEVLGLAAVLLARGAAAVLAPLTVVRELECADFVAEVHGELAAGEPFACAVAAVRRRWLAVDDLSQWAVASSFSCFGSGAVRLAD